jgi:membrane-anchored mycosin MYCP
LNFDVPEVPQPRESVSRPLAPPPPPPPVDGRPKVIALVGLGLLGVVLAGVLGIGAMTNAKGGKR